MMKSTMPSLCLIALVLCAGACKKGPVAIDTGKVDRAKINVEIKGLIAKAEKSDDDNTRAKLLAKASLLLIEKGDYKKAVQIARRAKRANPTEKVALATIAEYYLHQKKPAEAMILLSDLVYAHPDYARVAYLMGNAAMMTGDMKEAEMQYTAALKADPEDVKIHNNLATLLVMKGQKAAALKLLEKAMAKKPNYAPLYKNAGICAEQQGKKDAAKKYYDRYLELNPGGDDISAVKSWREKL